MTELVRACKCGTEILREQVEIVEFKNNTTHYRAKCIGCKKQIYLKARDVEKKRSSKIAIGLPLEEYESVIESWHLTSRADQHELLIRMGQGKGKGFFLSLASWHLEHGYLSKKQLYFVIKEIIKATQVTPGSAQNLETTGPHVIL